MNCIKQKGFTIIEILVVASTIGTLCIAGALIYAAWHFVSKFQ